LFVAKLTRKDEEIDKNLAVKASKTLFKKIQDEILKELIV
jgi:hypothetical protein